MVNVGPSWLKPISYSTSVNGIIVLLNSQPLVLLNFVLSLRNDRNLVSREKIYAERHLPHSFPYKVKRRYIGW